MSRRRIWRAGGALLVGRRSAGAARALLAAATNPPTVQLFPRADGPGSSQDLPQFQAMASRVAAAPVDPGDDAWAWSRGCLRTPGVCIDSDPIEFRIVPADDADAYEYYSPDFHDRPLVVGDPLPGEPRYFVHNILRLLGLRGVRIEAAPMPATLRGTGLGGSNLAHAAALVLGSAVANVDLDLASIYVAATQLENHFGVREIDGSLTFGVSMTGGQETLTAFQGGAWDNVHLPLELGPHGVVSRELVAPADYEALARHLLLVNVGCRRGPGVTSGGVNAQWMRAWSHADGARLHALKPAIAWDAAEALRRLDWPGYCDAMTRYRRVRADLCAQYVAGQEELEQLCDERGASWFPTGAGGGTCLVASPDAAALRSIRETIDASANAATGRVALPFNVREEGLRMLDFEEAGLRVPSAPADGHGAIAGAAEQAA